jgi:hypothetical protein
MMEIAQSIRMCGEHPARLEGNVPIGGLSKRGFRCRKEPYIARHCSSRGFPSQDQIHLVQ